MKGLIILASPDRYGWKQVYRRVTYDRDTEELLADERVEGMSSAQLCRELDKPRRLRVEFHMQGKTDPEPEVDYNSQLATWQCRTEFPSPPTAGGHSCLQELGVDPVSDRQQVLISYSDHQH